MSAADEKDIVNTWIDTLKIPTISNGRYTEDNNVINIQSLWSVDDVTKKDKVTFSKTFAVFKNSLNWPESVDGVVENPIIASSKPIADGCKLSCYSPSGTKKAVVIEKAGGEDSGQPKRELLQLWNDFTLLKTYDLSELDKHKEILSSGAWGCCMAWNAQETKLAYLAEKKVSKKKPFFSSYAEDGSTSNRKDKQKDENDSLSVKGEEYCLRQTWGEQLNDNYNSVIVVLDVASNSFNLLELSKDDFPMDLQWSGNSIVATSAIIPIWRLGLIFCSNRETRIFKIDTDGKNFKYLSPAGRGARSPRVSPDGRYAVWQERAVDGPHERARSVMGYDLIKDEAAVDLYPAAPPSEVPIYVDFPRNCWSHDSTKVFALTPSEAEYAIVILSVESEPVIIRPTGLTDILWIGKELMLVSCSSVLEAPTLQLVNIVSGKYQRVLITTAQPFLTTNIKQQYFMGQCSPPSIFFCPDYTGLPAKSVPLVVWPHGGPHAVLTNSFVHEFAFFLRSGYALLLLNYIGSIGGKKDVTDELLGFIGTRDVQDCQRIAEQVLKSVPTLNPNRIVIQGGSHGGFLTAQLISTFPDFYKAAVMRNPVIDLNTMVGTTDITDWVYAEAGVKEGQWWKTIIPAATSLSDAKEYQNCSPIMNVDKVKAPVLLLLGTEDLRVPMSQGLAFHRALLAHDKISDVRVYKDCHSLSKVAVRTDALLNWAIWFQTHLSDNGN